MAWNRLRTAYNGLAAETTILTQSSYSTNPERLANVAFTGAIQNMTDDADIQDFFWHVSNYYARFEQLGRITGPERNVVNQVLDSHCVGWNQKCNSWHRTAWHPLPQARTVKATFPDQQEHWIKAATMTRVGTGTPPNLPAVQDFSTPEPGGSQYIG